MPQECNEFPYTELQDWFFHEVINELGKNTAEIVVMAFIFDRTVRWSKFQERIPIRHFLDGVPGVRPGISISRRSLFYALESLQRRGFISRLMPQGGGYTGSNGEIFIIPDPRFRQKSEREECNPLHSRVQPIALKSATGCRSYNIDINIDSKERAKALSDTAKVFGEERQEEEKSTMAIGDSCREAITGLKKKTAAARADRIARGGALAWIKVWHDAYADKFPKGKGAITFDKTRQAILRNVVKQLPSDVDPCDFFKVVILHWEKIVGEYLPKMRKASAFPSITFLVKNMETFNHAYVSIKTGKGVDMFKMEAADLEVERRKLENEVQRLKDQKLRMQDELALAKMRNRPVSRVRVRPKPVKKVRPEDLGFRPFDEGDIE